jgi:hypothetical protein
MASRHLVVLILAFLPLIEIGCQQSAEESTAKTDASCLEQGGQYYGRYTKLSTEFWDTKKLLIADIEDVVDLKWVDRLQGIRREFIMLPFPNCMAKLHKTTALAMSADIDLFLNYDEPKAYIAKEQQAITLWNKVKDLHKELAVEAGIAENQE